MNSEEQIEENTRSFNQNPELVRVSLGDKGKADVKGEFPAHFRSVIHAITLAV